MKSIFSLIFIAFFYTAYAQNLSKSIQAKYITSDIKVDGVLNDSIWQLCKPSGDFWENFPDDTSLALSKTEVKMCYNAKYLYIAAICYDSLPGKYIVQTLKRDFSYPISDAFVVSIDPFSDGQNGFSFGVNPYGVQREGLIAMGGGQGVTTNWDNKWFTEVKRYANYWSVEMAIPFKTLRFKEKLKEWKVNFARNDLKRNENSTWVKVPRQFNISSLAFMGSLEFETPPQKNGGNISIIPYSIGRFTKDYTTNSKNLIEGNFGADGKIVLGNSLNLDLTINPDFSQVEVDRQITNLTRFSLFFPEQRQFFIENSDLFERFGFRQIRPFFSRRIGLDDGNIIPIVGGARLSGKPNKNWRVGLMNIQTAKTSFNFQDVYSQNYLVAAASRNVFKRSNLSAIFVNRQQLDSSGFSATNFNRVAGLDFNISSADNKLNGKIFYHHSFSNNFNNNAFAHASWLDYTTRNFTLDWNHEYVDKNYNAEVGFTPRIFQRDSSNQIKRLSYWRFEPWIKYNFYPKKSIINRITPNVYGDHYRNERFVNTDFLINPGIDIFFNNSAYINLDYNTNYTKLLYNTDVTFSGQSKKLIAGDYYYQNAAIKLGSNVRRHLYGAISSNIGSYFSGTKFSYGLELSYRLKHYAIFSVNYTRDDIQVSYLDKPVTLNLISPRIDFTFSKSLFLTLFGQYNSQAKNMNFNGRLQWRFKPMSDLFIVYSDNYTSDNLFIKNRAIVLKFIYWLSV